YYKENFYTYFVHIVFFFSRRRRHTISKRDWSSDVCSSDLPGDGRDADPRRAARRLRRLEGGPTHPAEGVREPDPRAHRRGRDRAARGLRGGPARSVAVRHGPARRLAELRIRKTANDRGCVATAGVQRLRGCSDRRGVFGRLAASAPL